LTTMDRATTASRADAGTLTPISYPKRIPFAAEYSTEDFTRITLGFRPPAPEAFLPLPPGGAKRNLGAMHRLT
jgi:hypothetical protein